MIAIAISFLFGIAAIAALSAVAGAIIRGYGQCRAIMAELARLDGRPALELNRKYLDRLKPARSAAALRHALA